MCSEVNSMANWMQSFEFVVLTSFRFKTLQAIDDVSHALQSSSLTLDDEAELMKSLISTLRCIQDSSPIILEECGLVAAGLGKRVSKRQDIGNLIYFFQIAKQPIIRYINSANLYKT